MFPLYDNAPRLRPPLLTIAIIVANTVVFLWMQSLTPVDQETVAYRWGFVPARIGKLIDHQPLTVQLGQEQQLAFWPIRLPPPQLVLPPDPRQIALSLLACMFLHGSWLHLIGNMWFLWIFGDNVEGRLGHVVYLSFYLVGGLAGSLAHWFNFQGSTMPVIGASGAIATILGAYAITWPWARVRTLVFLFLFVTVVDLPALLVLGLWFVGQITAGAMEMHMAVGQNVAWWAHIGGFVIGLVLMPLLSVLVGADRPPPVIELPDQHGSPDDFGW